MDRYRVRRAVVWLAVGLAVTGCTRASHVALLSDGNLDGRRLSEVAPGPVLQGEDCGMAYYLANAFREAVAGTNYDTLVDVEVTSTAGITPFGQCLKVKGRGVRSADLPTADVTQ